MNNQAPAAGRPQQERFERALLQSTRAIAGDKTLQVSFGALGPRLIGNRLQLPPPPVPLTPAAAAIARGQADRLALRWVHHNPTVHAKYRPAGGRARAIYDALEDLRCQSLGANAMRGIAENLQAVMDDALQRSGALQGQATGSAGMTQALTLLTREKLTGIAPPPEALALLTHWRQQLDRQVGASLATLADSSADQEQFAIRLHSIVRSLDLGYEIGAAAEEEVRQASRPAPAAAAASSSATLGEPLQIKTQQGSLEEDDDSLEAKPAIEELPAGDGDAGRKVENESGGARMARELLHDDHDNPNRHYKVYTRSHDEIVPAERLADDGELTELRLKLDREVRSMHSVVARLARKLERLLLSQQLRQWKFDLEEGALDAAKLARIVVDPLASLSFKQEQDSDFKDTVVSVLIDNSGSMRGRPIMLAALCADVLARTLERCGVKVEILGFTTQAWNGGASRADWIAEGRRSAPGRLSDLRYIIYKAADAPWRRARRNLGLMLREDLLKENIDGEALLWAHERLLARSEGRRILMVISDGVPLDEATLSINPGSYLEQHLRNVVRWIERRSPIELVAIGIGHDVTDYYQRAVAIAGAEQLGVAMVDQLASLFVSGAALAKKTRQTQGETP